jgi:hypothetical protein
MRAEIAFSRGVVVGIDIKRIVGTSLHAGLATDAAPVVEIHDSIGAPIESTRGTDYRAGGVIAVVAPHYAEVTRSVRKLALLDVLDPGAENTNWDLVFFFTRDRTSVTPDATVLIDDKSVSHLGAFGLLRSSRKHFSFDIITDCAHNSPMPQLEGPF